MDACARSSYHSAKWLVYEHSSNHLSYNSYSAYQSGWRKLVICMPCLLLLYHSGFLYNALSHYSCEESILFPLCLTVVQIVLDKKVSDRMSSHCSLYVLHAFIILIQKYVLLEKENGWLHVRPYRMSAGFWHQRSCRQDLKYQRTSISFAIDLYSISYHTKFVSLNRYVVFFTMVWWHLLLNT